MNPSSLLLLLVFAAMLFWMFSRSRRQQREVQQLQSSLSPGARIVTTAGLYATVTEIDGQTITLETAPGQQSQWDRRAVARVLPPESVDDSENDEDDLEEDAERHEAIGGAGGDVHDSYTNDDMDKGTGAAGTASASQETAPPDRA